MNFKKWFMIENTISQILNAQDNKELMSKVSSNLNQWYWLRQLQNNGIIVKYVTYWAIKAMGDAPNVIGFPSATSDAAVSIVLNYLHSTSDYISYIMQHQQNIAKSKFNNPNYTLSNLKKDSEDWHERLKTQARHKGPTGRKVEIAGMPNGFYWVSLDKGYCSKEGEAMGHCGNSGASKDDNIYSLRDNKGMPHLTFIVNNQQLGETKSFGNNKPSSKYYPQIAAFLLGNDNGKPIVEFISGGGYLPENNFDFNDLPKDLQQKVLAVKPYINDFALYMEHIGNGDPKKVVAALENEFDYSFDSYQPSKKEVILKKFDGLHEMIEYLKDETPSKIEAPDLDNIDFDNYDYDDQDAVRIFDDYANSELEKIVNNIVKKMEKKARKEKENLFDDGEEDDDNYDLAWAVEENDDLGSCLRSAANEGNRVGDESDAYKSLQRHFHNEKTDDGFFIEKLMDHTWILGISLNDLKELRQSGELVDLTKHLKFSYEMPHYGYSGFDKETYNSYLKDCLTDHGLIKARR